MIIEYKTIMADNIDRLDYEVTQYLKLGWYLTGIQYIRYDNGHMVNFLQPICRPDTVV